MPVLYLFKLASFVVILEKNLSLWLKFKLHCSLILPIWWQWWYWF